jgi:hypothetical protein
VISERLEQKVHYYDILPQEFRSNYLDSYFKEKLDIKEVYINLENRTITANVSVKLPFFKQIFNPSYKSDYIWSSLTTYRAVSQIALAYLCFYTKKTKKQIGDIYQKSSSSITRKPLYGTDNKEFEIKIEEINKKKIENKQLIFGKLKYRIINSYFSGEIDFLAGFKPNQLSKIKKS